MSTTNSPRVWRQCMAGNWSDSTTSTRTRWRALLSGSRASRRHHIVWMRYCMKMQSYNRTLSHRIEKQSKISVVKPYFLMLIPAELDWSQINTVAFVVDFGRTDYREWCNILSMDPGYNAIFTPVKYCNAIKQHVRHRLIPQDCCAETAAVTKHWQL